MPSVKPTKYSVETAFELHLQPSPHEQIPSACSTPLRREAAIHIITEDEIVFTRRTMHPGAFCIIDCSLEGQHSLLLSRNATGATKWWLACPGNAHRFNGSGFGGHRLVHPRNLSMDVVFEFPELICKK